MVRGAWGGAAAAPLQGVPRPRQVRTDPPRPFRPLHQCAYFPPLVAVTTQNVFRYNSKRFQLQLLSACILVCILGCLHSCLQVRTEQLPLSLQATPVAPSPLHRCAYFPSPLPLQLKTFSVTTSECLPFVLLAFCSSNCVCPPVSPYRCLLTRATIAAKSLGPTRVTCAPTRTSARSLRNSPSSRSARRRGTKTSFRSLHPSMESL